MSTLKLLPSNIQETDQRGGCYKDGFSKFKMIPTKLEEIRSPFGSGHGKTHLFKDWKNVMLNWQLEVVLCFLILYGRHMESKHKPECDTD